MQGPTKCSCRNHPSLNNQQLDQLEREDLPKLHFSRCTDGVHVFFSGCLKKELPKSWNKFPRHTRKSTESRTPQLVLVFPERTPFADGLASFTASEWSGTEVPRISLRMTALCLPIPAMYGIFCLLIYRINQMWVNTPIHGMGNDWIRSILNDRSSYLACRFRNLVIFSWHHVKMISQNTNSSCTSYMFY